MSTKLATILADFTTNLATALAVGGTSVSLQSATDDDGVALPAGTYFFTLDGQNAGKEHIVCTLSGTSLTNIKSVSRQGVETTGVVRPHRIGATVSLTDFAHILFINRLVGGIDMFDSSAPLEYDATASITKPNQFATKAYIDGIAIAGAPNASTTLQGLVQLATQAQIDARTTTGSTGALLVATPDKTRSTLLSDYIADTGTANTYAIAPVPAITAYAIGQRFSFKATNANTGTSTVNASGLGAKTIKKVGGGSNLAANDILAGQIVDVEYDGTNMQMMSPTGNASLIAVFGGTGADGALTITSGTTTIDCANAAVVIKNYSSISITGTGVLAFSNPHPRGTIITLKSQGNVTLTSSATPMINASVMGAAGGASSGGSDGNSGNNSNSNFVSPLGGSGLNTGSSSGSAGIGGTVTTPIIAAIIGKTITLAVGAGGASGGGSSAGTPPSGIGGNGGAALLIECAGALNFTTTSGISVAGGNGGNGTANGAGGGGGGGGGVVIILYKTLTAATGTITVAGGTGGTSSGTNANPGGGGGGGAGTLTNGSNGVAKVSSSGGAGGAGGAGISFIALNTEFI